MIRLVKPASKFQSSFIQALAENLDEPLPPLLNQLKLKHHLTPHQFLRWLPINFHQFLAYTRRPETITRDFPILPLQHHFWLVKGNDFIGRAIIRPHLTNSLRRHGGNLGIWIRPSVRRHGYGTIMITQAIQKTGQFGLKKVLLTCETSNVASQKLIQKTGARRAKLSRWTTPNRDRFWISPPTPGHA